MASAAVLLSIFAINRPHDPTTGLITQGYPIDSMVSSALSVENATVVSGVGIPAFVSYTHQTLPTTPYV